MNIQKLLTIGALIGGVAAGLGGIVAAIITHKIAFAIWGAVFIAGSIIAYVSGARGRPDGKLSPLTIGAKFERISMGAWLVIAGLCAGAMVFTFIVPPWK